MLPDSMNFIQKRYVIFISFLTAPLYLLLVLISTSFFSCTSSKEVTYFNDLADSQLVKLPIMPRPEAVIMPDDLLAIKISGANKTTEAQFNSYGAALGPANLGAEYYVDPQGNIDIFKIGAMKAAGYTREQFKKILTDSISTYLVSPVVAIKFVNFRFTVLGEVRIPGSYILPTDKVSILEALGQAGDMTQYARRNTVRVIRDSSGRREIGMIDFNQQTVFTSPYYYLQRNDVVYVEPHKSKTNYESVTRITPIIATAISILAVTLTFLNIKK